jgi:site-specific DNA-methyltransferase (adenine-specific)
MKQTNPIQNNKQGYRIMINLYNQDCMEAMASMKDNEFDLAIVDPPYGLGKGKTSVKNPHKTKNSLTKFLAKDWDDMIPPQQYFDELKRVSKNWIIWGANYFPISEYRNFIVWDKMTYVPTMSQVELAATSYNEPARYIKINSNQHDRIHPTQKPVALYMWLLSKYAKRDWKILDTHLGSGSSAIACDTLGYEFHGYELDEEYYLGAKKRLEQHQQQLKLPLGI